MADDKSKSGNKPEKGIQVFVSGKPDSVKAAASGNFDVTVVMGLSLSNPKYSAMVKVSIQNQTVDVVEIKEKKEFTFPNVKLDLSKPIEICVEKAGEPGNKDKATLAPPPPAAKKESERLIILTQKLRDESFVVTFRSAKKTQFSLMPRYSVDFSAEKQQPDGNWVAVNDLANLSVTSAKSLVIKFRFSEKQMTLRVLPKGMPEQRITLSKYF